MWHNPKEKTPPKDRVFLAAIKHYPWAVSCVYHPQVKEFLYQTLEEGMVDGQPDPYFESNFTKPEELVAWAEMPEIATSKEK